MTSSSYAPSSCTSWRGYIFPPCHKRIGEFGGVAWGGI